MMYTLLLHLTFVQSSLALTDVPFNFESNIVSSSSKQTWDFVNSGKITKTERGS